VKGYDLEQIYIDVNSVVLIDGISFDILKVGTAEVFRIGIRLKGYQLEKFFNLAERNWPVPRCFNAYEDYFRYLCKEMAKELRDGLKTFPQRDMNAPLSKKIITKQDDGELKNDK